MISVLNLLTCAICVICIAIAIWACSYFFSRFKKIRTDISAYLDKGYVDQSSPLHVSIEEYKKLLKGGKYTTEYASDFFSIDSLSIPYNFRLKVFSSIPNILTSLGILGTFLGLSLALWMFNSVDSEAIRNSINSLLAGMSTAFWTSVAGMASSAAFLFFGRRRVNNTEQDIDKLCSKLDSEFHRTSEQVIIDSFTHATEDGDIISPADSFSTMIESIKKMKTTLEMFGTDLCDSIGNAMDLSFQLRLVPIINDLAVKLENPAQTVTDSLVKELAAVCNSFKDNLTDGVNKQMDELLERFIDASNAINNIPDVIDTINKTFVSSTDGTLKAHEEISKALNDQMLRLSDLSDSFAEAIDKMTASVRQIESINSSLAEIPETFNTASEAIDSASGSLIESNSQVVQTINTLQEINGKTSEAVLGYTENIQSIQDGLKSIFDEINTGLYKYAEATKTGLQEMLDPFTTSISDATIKVANSIAPLNDAVDELSTFGDTVTKSLKDLSVAIAPLEKSIKRLQEINANEKN